MASTIPNLVDTFISVMKKYNKLIILAAFFSLVLIGCNSDSSKSSETNAGDQVNDQPNDDQPAPGGDDPVDPVIVGDADRGEGLYMRYCANCHGEDTLGGNFAPDISDVEMASDIEDAIRGVEVMSGLSGQLNTDDIEDIAAWLSTL